MFKPGNLVRYTGNYHTTILGVVEIADMSVIQIRYMIVQETGLVHDYMKFSESNGNWDHAFKYWTLERM